MVSKSLYRSVDMVNSISKAILVNQLIEEKDRVLVSISGGQDSICLLVLFNQLYAQMGLHLGLFWCQHLWQTDSFSLMRQISKISYLFQFDSCFAIPPKYVPSELLARNWRHDCSYRISLFYNYYKISLAHSAHDKAETILLNLMRGTGATGLSPLQWTTIIPEKSIQKNEHILECSRFQFSSFFWSPFCLDKVKAQSKRNEIALDVHHTSVSVASPTGSDLRWSLRCNQRWIARSIVPSFRSYVLQVFSLEHYEHLPPPISRWLKEKSSTNFLKENSFLYHFRFCIKDPAIFLPHATLRGRSLMPARQALSVAWGKQENSSAINKSSNSIDFTFSRFSLALTNPTSRVISALIPLVSLGLGEIGEFWEIEDFDFKYQLNNVGESKDSKLLKNKEMGSKDFLDQFGKINNLSIDLKSKIITKWIWNKFMTNPKDRVIPKKIAFLQLFSSFGNSNLLQNNCLWSSSVPWIVDTVFFKKRRKKFKLITKLFSKKKSQNELIVKSVKESKAKKWFSFVSSIFFKNCFISFEQI